MRYATTGNLTAAAIAFLVSIFQMTDLQAAIGRAQLPQLPQFIARRKAICATYAAAGLPLWPRIASAGCEPCHYRAVLRVARTPRSLIARLERQACAPSFPSRSGSCSKTRRDFRALRRSLALRCRSRSILRSRRARLPIFTRLPPGLNYHGESEAIMSVDTLFDESTCPTFDKLRNFPKYVRRQDIARFLCRYEIFKRQIAIKGSVVECGVHHGGGLMSWAQFSVTLEPYNYHRTDHRFRHVRGFPRRRGSGWQRRIRPRWRIRRGVRYAYRAIALNRRVRQQPFYQS